MTRKSIFAIVILFLNTTACRQENPNAEVDEGNITGEIYESKELGWTIEIPEGWEIIEKDRIEESDQKTKTAMEKVAGQKIDIKSLKHLISFRKNPANVFISTSEPFVEEYSGEFEANNKQIYALLFQTFVDQGIKVDTSSGKEIIQGLEFNTFYTTLYARTGEQIMNQVLYSKLLNGLSFGVTICYNNLSDKKTLLKVWKNSRFAG